MHDTQRSGRMEADKTNVWFEYLSPVWMRMASMSADTPVHFLCGEWWESVQKVLEGF